MSSPEDSYYQLRDWSEADRKMIWDKWALCQPCKEILIRTDPFWGGSLTVYRSGPNFYKINGCGFCRVLSEILDWDIKRQGIKQRNSWQIQFTDRSWPSFEIALPVEESEGNNRISFDFLPRGFLSRKHVYDRNPWPIGTIANNSLLSSGMVSFIQKQLRECITNHNIECQPSWTVGNHQWPARLLRIEGDIARLVDFIPDTMSNEYVALSYCWGGKSELELCPPFVTTGTNIRQLQQAGIAISELPLTIQHALLVTKLVEIRYIWIDSICIIQDSNDDWELEATKMAAVYAMAKLTIIAASSTSCHSGFLDVNLSYCNPTIPSQSPFLLEARASCNSGFHRERSIGHLDPTCDPIDVRGWTLQEELLSSRYIKFTKDDIQWRCNSHQDCMCTQGVMGNYTGLWQNKSQLVDQDRDTDWCRFTMEFSRRKFTKDTDKLIAISSLARIAASKFMAPEGQVAYIAGLWSCDFVRQINWVCNSGQMTDGYVAPSFSWASLNCNPPGAWLRGGFEHELCQFRAASVSPSLQGNIFGSVSAGSATLYGPVVRTTVTLPKAEHETRLYISIHEFEAWVTFDCPVSEKLHPDGYKILQRSRNQNAVAFGEYSVVSLALGISTGGSITCLLLEKIDDIHYQRIGYAESEGYCTYIDERTFQMLEEAREEVIII